MSVDNTHPYQVHFTKDRYHQVQDMVGWCTDQFGDGGYIHSSVKNQRWALAIAFGNSSWLFKNSEDATLFALRWT